MVLLSYSGNDLHIDSTYVLGWKSLGRKYSITECEGNLIKTVDYRPCFDEIYNRCLGIHKENVSVKSAIEFPLLIETNGVPCLKTAVSFLEDGSVGLVSNVEKGSLVQLAYGDPSNILEDDYKCVKEIAEFAPEAIKIFTCLTRRVFLGDEMADKETGCFEILAPTSGFYTGGELLSVKGHIYQLNCTMVVASFREGEPLEQGIDLSAYDFQVENNSLVRRLANFIGVSTKDLEGHFSDTLVALTGIYLAIYIFDIGHKTLERYSSPQYLTDIINDEQGIDIQMKNVLEKTVCKEHLPRMLEFADITTLQERLSGKKVISEDFIGNTQGWVRLQFVPLERDTMGRVETVICTVQTINEEKNKMIELIDDATRDKLTGLYNRRKYENRMKRYMEGKNPENLTFVSFDVNGLKCVNDSLGHHAGDELILGASQCISRCVSNYGDVFRIGGDEFAAILNVKPKELKKIINEFENEVYSWKGKLIDELSVSYGVAGVAEYEGMNIEELSKIADARMYSNKENYYRKNGIDRKGQLTLYSLICNSLDLIMKVNLTTDKVHVISCNSDDSMFRDCDNEQFSKMLCTFLASDIIHEDDIEFFKRKMDINYLKNYFTGGKSSFNVYFKIKNGAKYKMVILEMITAEDYFDNDQSLYLYVKDIDRN